MIAEALGDDTWAIESRYTTEDIAEWMAYFKIKNPDPKKGPPTPAGPKRRRGRRSIPRKR